MQSGPSFLVALDKESGKELWKADRSMDVPKEANQAYTTPAVHKTDQGEILYTVGADHITAHSALDGKLLWKVGGLNPTENGFFRSISSPVIAGDMVICPYARGASLTAVRISKPTLTETDGMKLVAWQKDFGSDVPTPAFADSKIFVLGDKGIVTCMNPSSGETIWTQQLPKSNRQFSSSPVVAGGSLYCTREDGTCFVLKADSGDLIATNKVSGNVVATPVFSKNRIYLRSYETLYCIE